MNIQIIEEWLKKYNLRTKQAEKNALREIAQQIALSGLARTDFFSRAAFVGGSCLRILYGLPRFSEDLDFWTFKSEPEFHWKPYLQAVADEFKTYAFNMEIIDRDDMHARIKRAFLKKESVGKILLLSNARNFNHNEKLQIKFEIDTHPFDAATCELKTCHFPYAFSLTALDRKSLFASKVAALFDREKEKGRHWFDFVWYMSQKWPLNMQLLEKVLGQQELFAALQALIHTVDWKMLKEDVRHFLPAAEQKSLDAWSSQYFLKLIEDYFQSAKMMQEVTIPSIG